MGDGWVTAGAGCPGKGPGSGVDKEKQVFTEICTHDRSFNASPAAQGARDVLRDCVREAAGWCSASV